MKYFVQLNGNYIFKDFFDGVLTEIEILRHIHHPYIVKLFEVIDDENS